MRTLGMFETPKKPATGETARVFVLEGARGL
jgi:hypothetical protein